MKKQLLTAAMAAALGVVSFAGVSAEEEKVYRSADSWMYSTLNPHVDYQGWQEFSYGGTEMLCHIEPDGSLVPWLAESITPDEEAKVWTITLKEGVTFSDGDALTADMVILNLEDVAANNSRYGYLKNAVFEAADEKTLTVTLESPYLLLPNDLADPDTSIIKMGEGQDIDNAPVGTGPFVVESFTPEQEVVMVKNDRYWNGTPQIDRAVFTLVPEQDSQTMAMQNGEISMLYCPSAAAIEMFSADPDNYDIVYSATSRLYYYYLNCETLDENVRKAINMTLNADDFVTIMNGLVATANGPFLPESGFDNVTKPAIDPEGAKALLEEDGYVENSDGYYEKDGQVLSVRLCYYPARSLDKLAALLQEQLANIGIQADVMSYEDPDAGYVTTGDYDIGLYNVVGAPSGDPYYFLNLTLANPDYSAAGYEDAEVQKLLSLLATEPDSDQRAALANQIVQKAIDSNAYGYLGFVVKATVLKKGTANVGEDNPYHGGLNVNSVVG